MNQATKKSLYEKSPSPRVDVDRGGPEPEGVVDHHGEPAAAAAVGPGGGGGGGLGHVRSGGRLGHARFCQGKVLSGTSGDIKQDRLFVNKRREYFEDGKACIEFITNKNIFPAIFKFFGRGTLLVSN